MSKSDVIAAIPAVFCCVGLVILFAVSLISDGRQEEKRRQTIEQRLQALENK